MKDDKKLAEKLTELLKGAEDHPLIKQLFAEKAAALLATRTVTADQIKAIEKERAEVIPRLLSDIEGKEEKFKKAKTIMEETGAAFQQARVALSTANNSYSHSISHLEQALIESSDPAIDLAKEFFNEKLTWLRSPGRISSNSLGGERNLFSETITQKSETNYPAILSAIDYCRDALSFLEQLKLQPAFDIQIIEAMKKAVPSIEIYTESTGERAMEGSKGRSFASYFKSADHADYEVRTLLEKAEAIIHPKKRARA